MSHRTRVRSGARPTKTGRTARGPQLTARGVAVALLSLGCLAFGATAPSPALVQISLLVILLLPLAWWLARGNTRGLTISRELPPSCFAGQLFTTSLALQNDRPRRDAFEIDVEDGLAGPTERGLSVPWLPSGGGKSARSFSTRVLRRGISHRLRTVLVSTWPFGLWKTSHEVSNEVALTVFPRPITPKAFEDATDTALLDVDEAESWHRDWMGDFHGLRAFQPGDRLKSVHWPTSARSRTLMVRQYDRPLPERYFVAFHSISTTRTSGDRSDAFESAMELLCGLIMHARNHAISLDLLASFENWRARPITSAREIENALYALAAARRTHESDIHRLVASLSEVARHTRVFIVSDVSVSEWLPLLPDFPFPITCLSVTELRIKQPGKFKRPGPVPTT
jgi:uncharacterized protein (DUF58 family)